MWFENSHIAVFFACKTTTTKILAFVQSNLKRKKKWIFELYLSFDIVGASNRSWNLKWVSIKYHRYFLKCSVVDFISELYYQIWSSCHSKFSLLKFKSSRDKLFKKDNTLESPYPYYRFRSRLTYPYF